MRRTLTLANWPSSRAAVGAVMRLACDTRHCPMSQQVLDDAIGVWKASQEPGQRGRRRDVGEVKTLTVTFPHADISTWNNVPILFPNDAKDEQQEQW